MQHFDLRVKNERWLQADAEASMHQKLRQKKKEKLKKYKEDNKNFSHVHNLLLVWPKQLQPRKKIYLL